MKQISRFFDISNRCSNSKKNYVTKITDKNQILLVLSIERKKKVRDRRNFVADRTLRVQKTQEFLFIFYFSTNIREEK